MRALMMTKKAGGGGWQPGANCVAYYPLENDFNDYSGHGYNLTNNGIVLGVSADGYKGGQLGPLMYATTTAFDLCLDQNSPRTIAFWTGCNTMVTGSRTTAIFLSYNTTPDQNTGFGYTTYNYTTWGLGNPRQQLTGWTTTAQPKDIGVSLIDNNAMHSYVITADSTNFTIYKDGVLAYTGSSTWNKGNTDFGFRIGQSKSSETSRCNNGYIRQVVIDAALWTAQDASDYHSGTA